MLNDDAPHVTLTSAQAFRDRGWRPFPLDHPSHPECAGLHGPQHPCDGKRGKHPTVKFGTACNVEPQDGLLATWWIGVRNIGIACGPSGLLVVDEDIDGALSAYAQAHGETLPATYRVRTSRGWHYYFQLPPGSGLGNRPGLLKDHGMDVRGVGGYVVAAGSVHETGHVYAAEDEFVVPAELPAWLERAIRTRPESDSSGDMPGSAGGEWTDEPRYGTVADLLGQYTRHRDAVTTRGGDFRYELYLAALDGWRLVNLGLLEQNTMLGELAGRVRDVWQASPDERDRHIVYTEAFEKAKTSPWVVIDPFDDASAAPPTAEEMYRRELEQEKRKERLRRQAREELAAESREPLRRLSFADFLSQPAPDYLIPRMLYRDGLAVVFGPPGAAKSFLMLDIALSVATGRPWRGKPVRRGRVHYVMAEGQATNTLRARAWLQHHDVDEATPDGWFDAFPQAVLLTEAGIVDYLGEVERDRPDLIVLDTKNLMFAGKESQGDDYGAMLRVLHQLRAAAGGCAIVLIDHTGLGDDTRVRGSNAQKGGVETEVRVVEARDGIREVTIERDKSGVTGARWLFRLEQVDVTPRPVDVDPPAVCVQVDPSELRPDAGTLASLLQGRWWDPDQPALPAEVAELGGRGADAARDIYRVLRFVADADGLTTGEIRAAIDESPRTHSKASFFAGLAVLKDKRLAVPGASAARLKVLLA